VSTTVVESVATATVSAVVAVESVVASVEAPPQATNAAIAKIANTFFILLFFFWLINLDTQKLFQLGLAHNSRVSFNNLSVIS
jgi:hypothetical protein